MLGADAVIKSADPSTGALVTVTFTAGHARGNRPARSWSPGRRCCDHPAAEVSCGYVNFFTEPANAHEWARAHPGVTGPVIGQPQAEQLGRDILGSLLPS